MLSAHYILIFYLLSAGPSDELIPNVRSLADEKGLELGLAIQVSTATLVVKSVKKRAEEKLSIAH
jgi:hypothetical protein